MMTVFDIVESFLRYRGYVVTYVRNITDIDDKIIRRGPRTASDRGAEPSGSSLRSTRTARNSRLRVRS